MINFIALLFLAGVVVGLLYIGYDLLDEEDKRNTKDLPTLVLKNTISLLVGGLLGLLIYAPLALFLTVLCGGSLFLSFSAIEALGFPIKDHVAVACVGAYFLIVITANFLNYLYIEIFGKDAPSPFALLKRKSHQSNQDPDKPQT
jgi:hypothetical protein